MIADCEVTLAKNLDENNGLDFWDEVSAISTEVLESFPASRVALNRSWPDCELLFADYLTGRTSLLNFR